LRILAAVVSWLAIFITPVFAWEKAEHYQLGDSALAWVLRDCRVSAGDSLLFNFNSNFSIKLDRQFWDNQDFGGLCASFSGNDRSRSRFHERGRSVLRQLKPLQAEVIDEVWTEHSIGSLTGGDASVSSVVQPRGNVIATYLLHHLIALRFAERAGKDRKTSEDALRSALIYEAMAQTYLADAFSSGHLLLPFGDPFYGLHARNNQKAHDFYRSEGVFVLNSKGEVWQTFGDKLLNWYAPSYEHVLEACVTSLRELFFVLCVSAGGEPPDSLKRWGRSISRERPDRIVESWLTLRNGEEYYADVRMPTLLLLPMPVSATWSVRNAEDGNPRNNHRKHFPQLREDGFHDPGLENIIRRFLYGKEDVPNWLVSDLASKDSPEKLIRENPDFASVRFVQQSDFPPSYVGLLASSGGGAVLGRKGKGSGLSFGLGYGLTDDFLLFNKISVEAVLMPGLDEPRRLLLGPSFGLGIKLPFRFDPVEAVRIEKGYVWGLRAPYQAGGLKFALGLGSRTVPLGFTYSGLTFRLKYQWIWLEQTKQGAFLEVVLH